MLKTNAISPSDLERAIEKAVEWLLSHQAPEGYFWAELESNVTITAEHLFLTHILGIGSQELWEGIAREILSEQREEGFWSNWYGGPGDLSTTIEAYVALKMAGVDPESPEMKKAQEWILRHGGVEKARVFTKIWLALLGEWPWEATPMLPPELVILPDRFPGSLYSFASWARATILPLAILRVLKPVYPLPERARIDELFPKGRNKADLRLPRKRGFWGTFFYGVDRALRLYERSPAKPLRKTALKEAEEWILARQEKDGCWGGIQPPWVYSLIALHALGYGLESPPIKRGLEGFSRYSITPETFKRYPFLVTDKPARGFRLQSCISPVWDTGLSLMALQDAGLPQNHPALVKAGMWLLEEQIFTGGDWQVRSRARPGGWAFEFDNDIYPDTDDTAVVLMALLEIELPERAKEFAVKRGLEWLLGMQSKNGGWGAFDRNNTHFFLRQIPFADFGEILDPPSADVTGHVMEFLGRMGYRSGFKPLDRALHYLWREQEEEGPWYGRWGVNYLYGTGCVIPALVACGLPKDDPRIKRAVAWLKSHQNPDGGWGEDVLSYHRKELWGKGPSSSSQTAWALLALLAAGETRSEAVRHGVEYLVRSQRPDGTWDEPFFTGTGFPTDFMIRYHLYRHVFPLMALGRYRRALRGEE
ncbi:squalene--hopene cyclase [Candidatus Bipolaricaulota bacterium]|nr:squalene--hopene cyclase [Candidatus Bipolaricaulota bacterium]